MNGVSRRSDDAGEFLPSPGTTDSRISGGGVCENLIELVVRLADSGKSARGENRDYYMARKRCESKGWDFPTLCSAGRPATDGGWKTTTYYSSAPSYVRFSVLSIVRDGEERGKIWERVYKKRRRLGKV